MKKSFYSRDAAYDQTAGSSYPIFINNFERAVVCPAFRERTFGGMLENLLSMKCTQKVRHKTKCRLWSIH